MLTMKLKLSITLGNAAMQDADDLSAALSRTASRLAGTILTPGESTPIYDANGNRVGEWRIS